MIRYKEFPAHIRLEQTAQGTREEAQTVGEHCRAAANYAAAALTPVSLSSAGYLAGLLHDCGKYTQAFAAYLRAAVHGEQTTRGTVNHTFAGVRFLLTQYHDPKSSATYADIVSELLAYAVGAHHGAFDLVDPRGTSGFAHRLTDPHAPTQEALDNFLSLCAGREELDALFDRSVQEMQPIFARIDRLAQPGAATYDTHLNFYLGLLARLLLSAVIEGDRRDTAAFCSGITYPAYPADRRALFRACLDGVEQKLRGFASDTPIQAARAAISAQCRRQAEGAGGMYRLNVPTGAGKTLTSLRYAAAHAARHGKQRLFFIMPLLTIIEQNSREIRECLPDPSWLLEHHSNVVYTKAEGEMLDSRELLAENWDAPIVITTLVQFLNTLFDGRTTTTRRFQALCDSVIVLDEVQTVPPHMLSLFNLALNFLTEIAGATVVLCSATQPCLEETAHPLAVKPPPLVPHDEALWRVLRRTVICDAGKMRLREIPTFAEQLLTDCRSLLIVCNKKAEAQTLYRALAADVSACFHLSTSMCAAHRSRTLEQIRTRLRAGEPVVCVSTQVIEAGVDISFEGVIRLVAGMDSVIQAAGRCNRNGERPGEAPVYLVHCIDERMERLPEIRRAQNATEQLLEEFARHPETFSGRLDTDEAIAAYYRALYREMPQGYTDYYWDREKVSLLALLADNPKWRTEESCRFFLQQAFHTAGAAFQVFDSETTDVLVPYGEGSAIIASLCSDGVSDDLKKMKELLVKARPYSVSLFAYQLRQLEEMGALRAICHGSVPVLQEGVYEERVGLPIDLDPTEVKACDFLMS